VNGDHAVDPGTRARARAVQGDMKSIRPLTMLRALIAVISVTVAVLFGQMRNPAQGTSTERATILSIGSSGGFVPVGFDFRNSARNIVNYDGSHYRPGPITMQYPGPGR
jgi:hypothetical protein